MASYFQPTAGNPSCLSTTTITTGPHVPVPTITLLSHSIRLEASAKTYIQLLVSPRFISMQDIMTHVLLGSLCPGMIYRYVPRHTWATIELTQQCNMKVTDKQMEGAVVPWVVGSGLYTFYQVTWNRDQVRIDCHNVSTEP